MQGQPRTFSAIPMLAGSRISTLLCTLLALLILLPALAPRSAMAAMDCTDDTSNAPTSPYTPIDTWIALPPGADHWYAFRDEGDATDIMVRMSAAPANGATFRVYTTAQMIALRRGETVAPVGAGAPLPALNDDLYWTGNFVESGIYYVQIERTNLSGATSMSSYMLSIRGARVSFPLLSFTKPMPPRASDYANCPATPPATPAPAATEVPTPAADTNSSPQMPLPAVGRLIEIEEGEMHWYAFRDEGDDAAIEIGADATPDRCLTFALWTPEQLALWERNQPFRPVGQGTPNAALGIDLFWTGSFVKSGTYYVVVARDAAAQGECTYRLRITGDDVSLILPGQRTP